MDREKNPHNAPRVSKKASRNPSADSKCERCLACVIRGDLAPSPPASSRRWYLRSGVGTPHQGRVEREEKENSPHRSCNAVASPVRNSSVPAREARLTAHPCRGSAEARAAGANAEAGSRSVLLSRTNVFRVTSGASSAGISSRGPEGGVVAVVVVVVEAATASGHASTRSEASAV